MVSFLTSRRSGLAVAAFVGGASLLVGCQRAVETVEDVVDAVLPGPEIAELAFVPQDALGFVTVAAQTSDYVDRAPVLLQSELQAGLDEFNEYLFGPEDLTYEEDVAPWIGEKVTLAFLDVNVNPDAAEGEEIPGFVLVMSTTDPALSALFMQSQRDRLTAEEGFEFDLTTENGAAVYTQQNGDPGDQLVTAEVDDAFILLANDASVMQRALTTYQQEDGVTSLDAFQTTLGLAADGDPLFYGYLNPALYQDPDFLAALEEVPELSAGLPPEGLEALAGMRSILMTTTWDEQAARARMLVDVDPDFLDLSETEMAAGEMIQRLPASSLMVITSSRPDAYWEQLKAGLQEDPEMAATLAEVTEEFTAETGLDLDTDIFGWMDGETAIVLLPDPEASNPFAYGMGAIIALETSDRETAGATFATLDELATEAGLRVSEADDQVIWGDPFLGQPMLVRAWQGDTVVLTSSPALQSVFGSDESLVSSGPLQAIYEGLPSDNAGYFMFNFEGALTAVEELVPPELLILSGIQPADLDALRALSGLGVVAYSADETHVALEALLTLADLAPTE